MTTPLADLIAGIIRDHPNVVIVQVGGDQPADQQLAEAIADAIEHRVTWDVTP